MINLISIIALNTSTAIYSWPSQVSLLKFTLPTPLLSIHTNLVSKYIMLPTTADTQSHANSCNPVAYIIGLHWHKLINKISFLSIIHLISFAPWYLLSNSPTLSVGWQVIVYVHYIGYHLLHIPTTLLSQGRYIWTTQTICINLAILNPTYLWHFHLNCFKQTDCTICLFDSGNEQCMI